MNPLSKRVHRVCGCAHATYATHTQTHAHIYIYICTCECMYVYICTHTHKHAHTIKNALSTPSSTWETCLAGKTNLPVDIRAESQKIAVWVKIGTALPCTTPHSHHRLRLPSFL